MGLSQRQFARAESCARSLVQRKIQSGHLKTLPDGTIDPALVGTPWRRGNEPNAPTAFTSEGAPPRWESERRRLNYEALLLRLKYERAVARVVLVEDVATAVTDQYARVRRAMAGLSDDCANRAARAKTAPEAKCIVDRAVNRILKALSDDGHARVDPELLPASERTRYEARTEGQ